MHIFWHIESCESKLSAKRQEVRKTQEPSTDHDFLPCRKSLKKKKKRLGPKEKEWSAF